MDILSILIIILFSLGILGISYIYFTRKKQIKPILKLIFKETKSGLFSFILTSLFFGTIVAVTLTGISANDKMVSTFTNLFIEQTYADNQIYTENVHTFDYDESSGQEPDYMSDSSLNGKYTYTSYNDAQYKTGNRNIKNESGWCQALVLDNIDLNSPKSEGGYYTIQEVIPGYPSYKNSSWLYKLEDGSGIGTSSWDTSYLYCLDYQVARMTDHSNESVTGNKTYNLSYSVETLVNLSASNSVSSNSKNYPIQIVTLPTPNKYNTFETYDKEIRTTASYFSPYNSSIDSLNLNEVFIVNNTTSGNPFNPGDSIYLNLNSDSKNEETPINSESEEHLTNNDLYGENNRNYELVVKDLGDSAKYIYPLDYTINRSSIAFVPESEIESENEYIYAFVTEETMMNIFYSLFTLTEGDKNTIPGELFPNEVSYGRDTNLIDVKFQLLNQNIFNSILYTNKEYFNIGGNSDFYTSNFFSYQGYMYNGSEIVETPENEYFDFQSSGYYVDYLDSVALLNSEEGSVSLNYEDNLYYNDHNNIKGFLILALNNDSMIYLYIFFFLVLGIIVSILIISKSFNKNIKQIGVLKSLGYSQSSISFGISFKVMLSLLLGIFLTFIVMPLIMFFWQYIFSSYVLVNIGFFSISANGFVFGILLLIGAFWIFSFVILRLFYIKQKPLDLLSDKKNNKANFIINSDFYSNTELSFQKKLSINWGTRSISKSLILIVSSLSITSFTVIAMSTQNILVDTVSDAQETFPYPLLAPHKQSRDTFEQSQNTTSSSITIEEFEEGIKNGTIQEYTFNMEKASAYNWQSATNEDFINEFNSLIWPYVENTPVHVNSKKYIPNDVYQWISCDVINNGPSKEEMASLDNTDNYENLSYQLLSFDNVDCDSSNNYDSKYGYSLGYDVYSKKDKVAGTWTNSASLMPIDSTIPVTNNGKSVATLFMDLDSLSEFANDSKGSSSNTIDFTSIDQWIETFNSKVNSEPDGIIPFYVSHEPINFPEPYQYNEDGVMEIVDNAVGTEYVMQVPDSWLYDTNDNGTIDSGNKIDDDSERKIEGYSELNPTFVYEGSVQFMIPFIGVFVPINDPDFILNTANSTLIDNDQLLGINNGSTNISWYSEGNGIKFDREKSEISTVDKNDWIEQKVILAGGVNSSKYTKTIAFSSPFYDSKTIDEYYYKGVTSFGNEVTLDKLISDDSSKVNLTSESSDDNAGGSFTNPIIAQGSNSIDLTETLIPILKPIIDSIPGVGLTPLWMPSLDINDNEFDPDARPNNSYPDGTTREQIYQDKWESTISTYTSLIELLIPSLISNVETIYDISSFGLEGGGGLVYSQVFVIAAEPSFVSFQQSAAIYSYFAIILTVILIFIVIVDLVNNNKRDSNLLKIQGYQPNKIVRSSFASYSFIMILGIVLAIPLLTGFSFMLTSIAPVIVGTFSVVLNTTWVQYLVASSIVFVSLAISFVFSYIYTKNSNPVKTLKQS